MAEKKSPRINWTWIIATILVLVFAQNIFLSGRLYNKVTYSEFLKLIDENKITDLVISDDNITGKYRIPPTPSAPNPERFSTIPAKDDKLVERLAQKNIPFQS